MGLLTPKGEAGPERDPGLGTFLANRKAIEYKGHTTMDRRKILICGESGIQGESSIRLLEGLDIEITAVESLASALRLLLGKDGFSLFVLRAGTIGKPALQILRGLKKNDPSLSVIGLMKIRDSAAGIALVENKIFDLLVAPGDGVGLYAAVRSELKKRDLVEEKEKYIRILRKLKAEQSRNEKRAFELEEIYASTVENLMTALDLRDVETFGHSQTVAKYSQVLAKLLGIDERPLLDNIRLGALLHDIGKIAIPDAILHKPGNLTDKEWEKIKLHPSLGYGLIKEIKLVEEVGHIILCHHERFDGSGYPRGLRKSDIPLEARIFALADALDAITAHRPYRKARDFPTAKKEILAHSGTQFDPKAVEAFCSLKPEKWERIRFETTSYIPNIEEFSRLIKSAKI